MSKYFTSRAYVRLFPFWQDLSFVSMADCQTLVLEGVSSRPTVVVGWRPGGKSRSQLLNVARRAFVKYKCESGKVKHLQFHGLLLDALGGPEESGGPGGLRLLLCLGEAGDDGTRPEEAG